jgi:hypothetical protein
MTVGYGSVIEGVQTTISSSTGTPRSRRRVGIISVEMCFAFVMRIATGLILKANMAGPLGVSKGGCLQETPAALAYPLPPSSNGLRYTQLRRATTKPQSS